MDSAKKGTAIFIQLILRLNTSNKLNKSYFWQVFKVSTNSVKLMHQQQLNREVNTPHTHAHTPREKHTAGQMCVQCLWARNADSQKKNYKQCFSKIYKVHDV